MGHLQRGVDLHSPGERIWQGALTATLYGCGHLAEGRGPQCASSKDAARVMQRPGPDVWVAPVSFTAPCGAVRSGEVLGGSVCVFFPSRPGFNNKINKLGVLACCAVHPPHTWFSRWQNCQHEGQMKEKFSYL